MSRRSSKTATHIALPDPPRNAPEPLKPTDTPQPALPHSVYPVRPVPLAQVRRDEHNHRQAVSIQAERVRELAESMRAGGQLQPVLVCELPGGAGGSGGGPSGRLYDLVFGFRRCAAAELNGQETILAAIAPPLSDLEKRTARAVENLQRQDLTQAEQLQAVLDVLAAAGGSVEQAAGILGKSASWVRDHQYLTRLSDKHKKWLAEGQLNIAHARQLAKVADPKAQDEITRWGDRGGELARGLPDKWFVDRIEREAFRALAEVPWKLEVPFAGKPACSLCPHNTANDRPLFETSDKAEACCAFPACFARKRQAADASLAAAVKKIAGTPAPAPGNGPGNARASGATRGDGRTPQAGKGRKPAVSPDQAEQVAAAFIRPEAIVEEAAKPPEPQRNAYGQRVETPQQKQRRDARYKLGEARRKWQEKCRQVFLQAIKAPDSKDGKCAGAVDARRLVVVEMLKACAVLGDWCNYNRSRKKAPTPEAAAFLARVAPGDDDALAALAAEIVKTRRTSYGATIPYRPLEEVSPSLWPTLAGAWGVALPPEPTLADFLPAKKEENHKGARATRADTGKSGKGRKPFNFCELHQPAAARVTPPPPTKDDHTPIRSPNAAGVFPDAERIDLPIPKSAKIAVTLLLARSGKTAFHSAIEIRSYIAGVSSLACVPGDNALFPTRQAALYSAAVDALTALNARLHEAPEKSQSRVSLAISAVNQWMDRSGIRIAPGTATAPAPVPGMGRKCRVCGCTDQDCRQCVEKTGQPCHWIEQDLCSACQGALEPGEVPKRPRRKAAAKAGKAPSHEPVELADDQDLDEDEGLEPLDDGDDDQGDDLDDLLEEEA